MYRMIWQRILGVPDDGTDIPVKKSLEEAASEADVKVDTEIIHVHRYFA